MGVIIEFGSFFWNLGFRKNVNDLEAVEFSSLISIIENFLLSFDGSDYRIWSKESSCCFSAQSLFNALLEPFFPNVGASCWKVIVAWKFDILAKL